MHACIASASPQLGSARTAPDQALGNMTQYGATARKPVSARRNLAPVLGMVILGMAALALTRMQPMHQEVIHAEHFFLRRFS